MPRNFDTRAFNRALKRATDAQIEAARRALDVAGEHVVGLAQQYSPVDTGALAASGTTLPATGGRDGLAKAIGFNTGYAAAVHERPGLRVNLAANPLARQRYLADAMAESADAVGAMVADAMRGEADA